MRDLHALRLHVLLSGPTPQEIERLLASEVDPVERRQLTIMRTEREIFEACLAKLPPITPSMRPRSVVRRVEGREGPASTAAKPPPPEGKTGEPTAVSERRAELGRCERQVLDAAQVSKLDTLVAAARHLADLAREGEPLCDEARELFERAVAAVETVGLRSAALATDVRAPLSEAVEKVVALAELLEDGRASSHKTASFMRQRALSMIDDAIGFGGAGRAITEALGEDEPDPTELSRARLGTLRRLVELRQRLVSRTGSTAGAASDEGVARAMGRAEQELAAVWSGPFARAFEREGGAAGNRAIEGVLGSLEPELARLTELDRELSATAGRPTRVLGLVAAPRIGGLVKSALLATRPDDRAAFVRQVGALLATLDRYELRDAVPVEAWLSLSAEALLRAEPTASSAVEAGASRKAFVAMRTKEQRTPVALTLAEVALMVSPALATSEAPAMERVAAVLDALAAPAKSEIARVDLARIGRAVDYLEAWWSELDAGEPGAFATSGFLEVLWDDQSLLRFSVEARLLEELVPGAREGAAALRARLEQLNGRVHAASLALLEQRADARWRATATK